MQFVRYARENRFQMGLAETLDCQRLACKIGVEDKKGLKLSLKGIMCSNVDDWERYDRLFDLYWQHDQGKNSSRVTHGGSGVREKSLPSLDNQQQGKQSGARLPNGGVGRTTLATHSSADASA